jgi:phage/plasmid-like protein (TIGR03299 family)
MSGIVLTDNARGGANLLNVGNEARGVMTPDEALDKAGLNFTVELRQCRTNEGQLMDGIAGNMYTVRTDNNQVLGNGLSKGYGIIQNQTAMNAVMEICGHTGSSIERIGSRKNGANWFCIARLPQEYNIMVGREDPAQVYMIFQNSHDGSGSLKITFTSIRLSCFNQMPAILREGTQLKFSHTSGIIDRMFSKVDNILMAVRESIETLEVSYNQMLDTRIDREKAIDLIDYLIGSKMGMYKNVDGEKVLKYSGKHESQRNKIIENLDHDSNNVDNMRGTVWAVYNAYTYFIDHQRTLNSTTGELKPEGRENAIFNDGRRKRERAVARCLEVC